MIKCILYQLQTLLFSKIKKIDILIRVENTVNTSISNNIMAKQSSFWEKSGHFLKRHSIFCEKSSNNRVWITFNWSDFFFSNEKLAKWTFFWSFSSINPSQTVFIGGHGFWDKGGVYTGVCPKKFCGRLWRPEFFFHRGVKIFFLWGVLLVDRGVILQKNDKK